MKIFCILRRLKKEKISVETKEGKKIAGFLDRIDKKINIKMSNCVVLNSGDSKKIENLIIKGSNVRYILFDEDFNTNIFKRDIRPKIKKKFTKCNAKTNF